MVVGSMVLNAVVMASFFGVSLSQRSALNRLEVALNEKNSLLAGTSVAGLLTSLLSCFLACMLACLLACLLAYLLACLLARWLACLYVS